MGHVLTSIGIKGNERGVIAEPCADEIVERALRKEQTVRCFVSEDRKPSKGSAHEEEDEGPKWNRDAKRKPGSDDARNGEPDRWFQPGNEDIDEIAEWSGASKVSAQFPDGHSIGIEARRWEDIG